MRSIFNSTTSSHQSFAQPLKHQTNPFTGLALLLPHSLKCLSSISPLSPLSPLPPTPPSVSSAPPPHLTHAPQPRPLPTSIGTSPPTLTDRHTPTNSPTSAYTGARTSNSGIKSLSKTNTRRGDRGSPISTLSGYGAMRWRGLCGSGCRRVC